MEDLKVDENFILKQSLRFQKALCADGIERVVYAPINTRCRDCRDCHFFEVDVTGKGVEAWCSRNSTERINQGPSIQLKPEDFEKAPRKCGCFHLLGITNEFRRWVNAQKPGETGHENLEGDFRRSWDPERK